MLSERQKITVRILEPCNPSATWRLPNSEIVLCQTIKSLERHAARNQLRDGGANIRDKPTQRRIRCGLHLLDFLHAQRDTIGLENQCKRVFRQKAQTQGLLVKITRSRGIGRCDESHQCGGVEHDKNPD